MILLLIIFELFVKLGFNGNTTYILEKQFLIRRKKFKKNRKPKFTLGPHLHLFSPNIHVLSSCRDISRCPKLFFCELRNSVENSESQFLMFP